jgi:hypothetical protein
MTPYGGKHPHHLWNTKNAPAVINANPKPWLSVIGSRK